MQRSEEELRAGVREREAGQVSVRKSVRTEREVVRVPKRREEVDIERVPVEGEAREASGATEADIGEDEVVLQVFEEEVVVTKRVVLKEEIRLRKRVVEDEEIVEVDLRKEEVEIDDQSGRGGPQGSLAQERDRRMAQENIGKRFEGYQIYDQHYEKVGKVDDLFVDENDVPEYIGVKTGLFGGPSTLIPMDIVRVNDLRQLVEVASDKDTIKNAPSFADDAEITAGFEDRVYAHFGATREAPPTDRGGYGAYHGENPDVDVVYGERSLAPGIRHRRRQRPWSTSTRPETAKLRSLSSPTGEERGYKEAEPREGARVYDWDIGTEHREMGGSRSGAGTTDSESIGTVGPGMSMGDTETGEFREHDRNQEGLSQPGSDLEDEDELRVQRSEEELLAGTREREAGSRQGPQARPDRPRAA